MGECFSSRDEFDPAHAGDVVGILQINDHELLVTEHCLGRMSMQLHEPAFARYDHIRIIMDDGKPAHCFAREFEGFETWSTHVQEETVSDRPAEEVYTAYWSRHLEDDEELTEDDIAERDRVKALMAAKAARKVESTDLETGLRKLLG